MLSSGPRDRRVRFEQAQEVVSESGEKTLVWLPFFTTWAERTPLSGTELYQAQQLAAKVDTRFRILWGSAPSEVTPTSTYRLVCEGRTYDITHVSEVGRRGGLELLATARTE